MDNYLNYFYFDDPVPYKGIKIYPIKVKEYLAFSGLVSCLMIEKNLVKDVKVISMDYLEYLFHISPKMSDGVFKFIGWANSPID